MNKLKHKPNLDAQMREHEMPEYQGKWKNYYFYDGRTIFGQNLFASAKEAKQNAWLILTDNTYAKPSEFVVIQIPVAS